MRYIGTLCTILLFCCESKTDLKNKVYFLENSYDVAGNIEAFSFKI